MYIVLIADNTTDTTRGPRIHWRRGLLLRMRNCSRQANANAVALNKNKTLLLHSLPMNWTSILVRHFCRRIFCCTFPLRCIIWPLGCMKDSIERQRRPTCRSESQPVPPGVVDSVVVAMPWLACSVRDSEKCEFCLSGHSSVRQLGLTQRLLLLLFGGATECGRGGSHNDSHVCVVFWCTHCNCNWMTDGRRLNKEETNYIAFLETAQGG